MNKHLTTLRDYQSRAIKQTYDSMRKHRTTMLQLPTGAGKSHIAAAIMEHALKNDRRVAFLVDRIVLSDQILDRLFNAGLPISVMQADHPMYSPRKPIQIVSIQTLARRGRRNWPEVDLFIQDEAHVKYSIIGEVMSTWNNVPWLGLSATPFTRGLGLLWENLVVGVTTKELIEQGYLADYDAFGPDTPDLRNIPRSNGDYAARALEERMNSITGNIVKHYMDRGEGKKALAFTPTVAYSQYLANEFKRNGIDADHVSAHDTDEQRTAKMRDYRAGRIKVMCNCEVLTRGFDMGDIEYGILARPTRSLALHIQMIGRFLRTADGKGNALIMDHAGNIGRLGFPDDDLPRHLDMGEPNTNSDTRDIEEPQPWTCPKCFSMVPPRTPQCQVCGHIARRQPEVEVKSGILQRLENPNITAGQLKQNVYSQLLHIARERGYARGWVAHKYKSVFNVWPRKMQDVTAPPTDKLLSWVTSQNIRHAKRRQKYG